MHDVLTVTAISIKNAINEITLFTQISVNIEK